MRINLALSQDGWMDERGMQHVVQARINYAATHKQAL